MPNIRTYNAGDLALRPTETGVDSYAQAGRRITSIYSDIASDARQGGDAIADAVGSGVKSVGDAAVSYMDHQQISAGMPAAASLLLNLQQQSNDITKKSDPNNPSVYGKFRDEVLEPSLQQFQESFSTEKSQQWAMEQANGIREHMQHKMIADMSTMASNAVTLNLNKTVNTASNAVYQDPSALDFTMKMLEHSTGATVSSSPNITPEDAARVNGEVLQKMNEKVVRAAVQGAIEKNPDAGLKMAQDPKYAQYIDGGEASRFAQEVKRQNKSDEINARVLQDRQTRLTSEKTFDDTNVALHSDQPPTLADIRRIPGNQISAEHREALFNIADRINNKDTLKPAAVYAQGEQDVISRIWKPQGDPDKITNLTQVQKEYADGVLNYQGYQRASKELLDPRDEAGVTLQKNRQEAMQLMSPLLNPQNDAGTKNHQGYDRTQTAYIRIRQLEQTSAEKTGDSNNVYNPKSPFYYRNDPAFQPPSPWKVQQESTQNMKSERVPDSAAPAVAPPRPKDAPPDATWNPVYGAYTKIDGGRIKGWK